MPPAAARLSVLCSHLPINAQTNTPLMQETKFTAFMLNCPTVWVRSSPGVANTSGQSNGCWRLVAFQRNIRQKSYFLAACDTSHGHLAELCSENTTAHKEVSIPLSLMLGGVAVQGYFLICFFLGSPAGSLSVPTLTDLTQTSCERRGSQGTGCHLNQHRRPGPNLHG